MEISPFYYIFRRFFVSSENCFDGAYDQSMLIAFQKQICKQLLVICMLGSDAVCQDFWFVLVMKFSMV